VSFVKFPLSRDSGGVPQGQPRHLPPQGRDLEPSGNLPDPDVIAQEIVEDLEAALEQFGEIVGDLGGDKSR
jgi:hypothetical protein